MKKSLHSLIRFLALLLLNAFLLFSADAQDGSVSKPIPEFERDACFVYATDNDLYGSGTKVIIISSYIYRQMYFDYKNSQDIYGTASAAFFSGILNAFDKKLDEISSSESVSKSGVYAPLFNSNLAVSFFETARSRADGFCPSTGQPSNSLRSTARYAEECRRLFIEEKRRQGYKIFQVDFGDYINQGRPNFVSESTFIKVKDQVSKLDPIYVERYESGCLKRLAKVESGSNAQKSESNRKKQTTPESDETIRARLAYKKAQASELEVKGDRYYQLGSSFFMEAYNSYKEAYTIFPSASLQKKITTIENEMKVVQSIIKTGEKIDVAVNKIDPEGKTNYSYGFLQYNGLVGFDRNPIKNNDNRIPTDIWLGVTGQRLFISFQARVGYFQSTNFEVDVKRTRRGSTTNNVEVVDSIKIGNSGIGLGLSAGLNLPINHFQFYGLYGWDIRFGLNSTMTSKNFRHENPRDLKDLPPNFLQRIELGVNVRLPKTRLGLGVNYSIISTVTKSKPRAEQLVKTNPSPTDLNGDNIYTINTYTQNKYKFGVFGVKFFWMLN